MKFLSAGELLKISRPRFWLYVAGPYLVGFTLAANSINDYLAFPFIYSFLYFLIPANFLVYAVNDAFDIETDIRNPKKGEKERRIKADEQKTYLLYCILSLVFAIPLLFFSNPQSLSYLAIFLFLSIFYSAPPLRFKSRPFLDFLSNILYAMPGFFAFAQFSGNTVLMLPILLAFCWTGAMHLFSAIPDISSDKNARIQTTATFLGKNSSLLLCSFLWLITSIGSIGYSFNFIFSIIYPIIPLYHLFNRKADISKTYWKFPYINAIAGFLLFLIFSMHLL